MADDKTKPGRPDRDRINVNEEDELRDWSKSFGVSPEELKKAVAAVGDRADAVRQHLGKYTKLCRALLGRPRFPVPRPSAAPLTRWLLKRGVPMSWGQHLGNKK